MSTHPLTKSRQISERWVIEGDLMLQTPTHLGNGDSDSIVDMPLLLDEATGKALLPGTSLAGALRNYVYERRHGFGVRLVNRDGKRVFDRVIEALFGAEKENKDGAQSALIIDDALGEDPKIELRDGVRIDPVTRTARIDFEKGKPRGYKYDLQLIEAGTTFPLHLELLIGQTVDPQDVKKMLALALQGLAEGEIAIGLRKRRGFGECRVTAWRVQRYDLKQAADLIAWLALEHPDWGYAPAQPPQTGKDIAALLGVSLAGAEDRRSSCAIRATFVLDGSLLIRSGFGEQDRGPDAVHLHSARPDGSRRPVLSGTSLAGALRHRAERIVRTISNGHPSAIIDNIFGPAEITGGEEKVKASRLVVKEAVIENPLDLVQNRIRIDRFTGSVHGTGLFNEQPVFGKEDTLVTIDLMLRNPADAEIGLLLLAIKDLWTGDLPLGGEVSIGRGRLRGVRATITTPQHKDAPLTIEAAQDGRLTISNRKALESYVEALHEYVRTAEVTR
ncbi:MAG: RAMP superfamily CRISPR-associated protein [Roseiflexaceae bacterium]|nr:RAMP superfamily CRISPR-associated protein [Roseiflexaceae bacterium]